jgi:flagellin
MANRHLSRTDDAMQASITRLATGLRINSASDDPAGLVISEGLRALIRGIEQAGRNTQDAVNMAKTAEAALSEVSDQIVNLRALAVHSANTAVVDAAQLEANQNQVREIIASINRIAEQTAWGEKKLLNGASGTTTTLTNTALATSLFLDGEINGTPIRTGGVTITRVTAATQTSTGALATSYADAGATVNEGTFVINGRGFTVPAGATVSQVVSMINQAANETGVLADIVGSGPVQVRLTSAKYGSNFPINYLETSDILNGGNPANPAVGVDAVFNVTVPVEPSPDTATEVYTGGNGPGVDGLTLRSPSGGRLVVTQQGNATAGAQVIGQVNVGSLRFQIGAFADQAALFSIPSMYAEKLGTGAIAGESLATIDLTSREGAEKAMRIVDSAIADLNGLRGDLGSFQKNFLESTVRSLGVAYENVAASESNIRDVDMAREMSEYTRVQILRQSGIAVLAQANQLPQGVLQLLQG